LSWKQLYQTAILEADGDKVPQRIFDARELILNRIEDIANRRRIGDENQLLVAALDGLENLRKAWAHWNSCVKGQLLPRASASAHQKCDDAGTLLPLNMRSGEATTPYADLSS
jgi:hypothetical protein